MAAESGEELQMEVHFPSGSVEQFGSSIIVLFIFEFPGFWRQKLTYHLYILTEISRIFG